MSHHKNLFDELSHHKTSSVFDDDWSGLGSKPKSKHSYARCYHSHQPLKLPNSDLVIHGGSCIDPAVKDADVYIGFDGGMRFQRSYPWHGRVEFLFHVTDMAAPSDAKEFKNLVSWTIDQLEAGKKVHAGCIGGHGRTGTFFAALVATLGEQDAIVYVRKHYCQKAVESTEQVKFLEKHYGVLPAPGAKSHGHSSKSSGKAKSSYDDFSPKANAKVSIYSPLVGAPSIWDR